MKAPTMRFIALLVFAGLLLATTPARADAVDNLSKALATNPSFKVRLTAVLMLVKYAYADNAKATKALINALEKDQEDPRVRAFAASGLGKLRVRAALPGLRKAARAKHAFLRGRARKVLKVLCPKKVTNKKFYVNLDSFRSRGPQAAIAKNLARTAIAKMLAGRADVLTGWPGCKKPKQQQLKRKQVRGLVFETKVKVSKAGEEVACRVDVLVSTFPGQSLKGSFFQEARMEGRLDRSLLGQLVTELSSSLQGDLLGFLDRF